MSLTVLVMAPLYMRLHANRKPLYAALSEGEPDQRAGRQRERSGGAQSLTAERLRSSPWNPERERATNMNARDLIEMLEDLDPETEIRLAHQPSWPFEYSTLAPRRAETPAQPKPDGGSASI